MLTNGYSFFPSMIAISSAISGQLYPFWLLLFIPLSDAPTTTGNVLIPSDMQPEAVMVRIVDGTCVQPDQRKVLAGATKVEYKRIIPERHLFPVAHEVRRWHVGHLFNAGNRDLLGRCGRKEEHGYYKLNGYSIKHAHSPVGFLAVTWHAVSLSEQSFHFQLILPTLFSLQPSFNNAFADECATWCGVLAKKVGERLWQCHRNVPSTSVKVFRPLHQSTHDSPLHRTSSPSFLSATIS